MLFSFDEGIRKSHQFFASASARQNEQHFCQYLQGDCFQKPLIVSISMSSDHRDGGDQMIKLLSIAGFIET